MDDSLKSIFRPPVDPDAEPSGPPPKFRLTTSNQWLLVLAAMAYSLIEVVKDRSTLTTGAPFVVGLLVGTTIFSSLISWIAFRLSGRSVLVGSIAFNGMIVLMVLGQLVPVMMQKGPSTVGGVTRIEDRDDGGSRSGRGPSDRLVEIVTSNNRETQALTEEWKASWNRMIADLNFNFAIKPDGKELARRRYLFAAHVAVMKKMNQFHDDMVPRMNERCAEVPRSDDLVKFLEKFATDHKVAMSKVRPLWDDHLKVAEMLVVMTDDLAGDPDGWTVQDDTIVFTDAKLQKRYEEHSDGLTELLQRIDDRAAELRGNP